MNIQNICLKNINLKNNMGLSIADRIDVITNFAVIMKAVINRGHCI